MDQALYGPVNEIKLDIPSIYANIVMEERQMFYKVVMYKDYDGSSKMGRMPSGKLYDGSTNRMVEKKENK